MKPISRRYFKTTAPIANPLYDGRYRRGLRAVKVYPVGTEVCALTFDGGFVEYEIGGCNIRGTEDALAEQDTGDHTPPASFEQLAERRFASRDRLAWVVLEKLIEEGRVSLDEIEQNYL